MKRFVFKGKGKLWPTVTWQDTKLVVYYLSDFDDEVEIRETNGIDFNEFFFHLDCGGSIYVTVKPTQEGTEFSDLNPLSKESRKVVENGYSLRRERPLDSSGDLKAREEDVSTWMTN